MYRGKQKPAFEIAVVDQTATFVIVNSNNEEIRCNHMSLSTQPPQLKNDYLDASLSPALYQVVLTFADGSHHIMADHEQLGRWVSDIQKIYLLPIGTLPPQVDLNITHKG
ncbi:uncharacterized protein LOC131939947 [Physella acuta]|uniref:uncharacterized protein LOC131939947 n=1 Tax=Physella acuta TaxID=109671 RepID=UPI0027DB48F0|nr:uncharacterized protein LOC131939947 [Physella acuta]